MNSPPLLPKPPGNFGTLFLRIFLSHLALSVLFALYTVGTLVFFADSDPSDRAEQIAFHSIALFTYVFAPYVHISPWKNMSPDEIDGSLLTSGFVYSAIFALILTSGVHLAKPIYSNWLSQRRVNSGSQKQP